MRTPVRWLTFAAALGGLALLAGWLARPSTREPEPEPESKPAAEPPSPSAPRGEAPPQGPAEPREAPATAAQRVRGVVVGTDAQPVAGASVAAWPAPADGRPSVGGPVRATTDEAGRFDLPGTEAGHWNLSVESPLHAGAAVQGLRADASPARVVLGDLAALEVRLVDASGGTWTETAVVQARWQGAYSGGAPPEALPGGPRREARADAGAARVRGLAPGRWLVEAHAEGWGSEGSGVEVEAGVGGTIGPVELRMVALARLSGRVLDAGTDAPWPEGTVLLWLRGTRRSVGAKSRVVEIPPSGDWSAEGLAAGDWAVEAVARSGRVVAASASIAPGARATLDLADPGAAEIEVRVVDGDGAGVADVRVEAVADEAGGTTYEEPAERPARPAAGLRRTDAEGRVLLPVTAGRVRLEARRDADSPWMPREPQTVDAEPGGRAAATLVVRRASAPPEDSGRRPR